MSTHAAIAIKKSSECILFDIDMGVRKGAYFFA